LLEINNPVVAHLDLAQVLKSASACLKREIEHDFAALALYNPERHELRLHTLDFPDDPTFLKQGQLIPLVGMPAAQAFSSRKTALRSDTKQKMVLLDMPSGLRRGELAGLKWGDFDFRNLHVSVTRSLVDQHVGPVKTETSRKLMPIDEYVARDLLAWYAVTPYKEAFHYVWATDAKRAGTKRGKQPVWLSTVMRYHIQPIAQKLGIAKKLSWHTFRHTFSSLLKANGEDVKVVQELLRHATSRMTLDTYTQALSPQKRAAQSKVVSMIRPERMCISCVSPRKLVFDVTA
jgi:site-specific recombinase XerD